MLLASERNKRWRRNNPERQRITARDLTRRYRQEILTFFGRKCARCGFDDWRALNVDHIIPCGTKARMNAPMMRAYIRRNPEEAREKLQCLCANCNQIKTHENNERPGAFTRKGVRISTRQNRLGLRLEQEVPNVAT